MLNAESLVNKTSNCSFLYKQLIEGAIEVVDVADKDSDFAIQQVQDYAFYHCSTLTVVNLPNVTNVGNYAFYSCVSLARIHLPNAESIGNSAFRNCSALVSANLPNAKSVGHYAFVGCESLVSVDLSHVTSIGDSVFCDCFALRSINLPSVTNINGNAFHGFTPDKSCVVELGIRSTDVVASYAPWGCKSKNVTFVFADGIADGKRFCLWNGLEGIWRE